MKFLSKLASCAWATLEARVSQVLRQVRWNLGFGCQGFHVIFFLSGELLLLQSKKIAGKVHHALVDVFFFTLEICKDIQRVPIQLHDGLWQGIHHFQSEIDLEMMEFQVFHEPNYLL